MLKMIKISLIMVRRYKALKNMVRLFIHTVLQYTDENRTKKN